VPSASFYTGPWLTLVFVALICLFRAYQLHREGPGDSGNTEGWQRWRVRAWALAGLGLLAYALFDWFSHTSLASPSMR